MSQRMTLELILELSNRLHNNLRIVLFQLVKEDWNFRFKFVC